MADVFRFPIALGLLAQRQGIDFAAKKAKKWATAPVSDEEATSHAVYCLKQFQKASAEKKADRDGG
jgi:alkanesulfonate monooxygenase SsuD/methylene tetrahydromethanopterin reductase-like flavin-dependent oxidoreductase (luciferase family)